MKKKQKKAVITGAAGFIGFHLAQKLLERGWSVAGIDSLTDYYDPRIKQKRLAILKKYPKFRFYKLNIAKYAPFEKVLRKEKPDDIIHLAAQAGVRYSLTDPWAYIESNMLGTLNVFEAAKRLKLPRVLYASSSSVYGLNTKSPMSEDDRTDTQISVYAATKKANESLAHSYNALYGIETVGLRFFTVYGTWGRPDLALFKFVKKILSGEPIDVYGHGKMKRSFTHVSDIVAGIAAILDQAPRGRNTLYNLGGAEAVPLLAFIKNIEKEVGKKAKQRLLPMQAGDVRETIADWSKAHKELGFVPRTTMEEGIAEFVAWFRSEEKFLRSLKEPKQ
ncbi:MAG: SDR family NAD(P)-dependent oxidoreductase [Candidatus Pacebacteria bacterium]|nr:SDR family NAD(P)-dependent oxidoreductase [Candidatus Paceibacterota bacterium]